MALTSEPQHSVNADVDMKKKCRKNKEKAEKMAKTQLFLSARMYSSRSSSPWMRPDVETTAGRKA